MGGMMVEGGVSTGPHELRWRNSQHRCLNAESAVWPMLWRHVPTDDRPISDEAIEDERHLISTDSVRRWARDVHCPSHATRVSRRTLAGVADPLGG